MPGYGFAPITAVGVTEWVPAGEIKNFQCDAKVDSGTGTLQAVLEGSNNGITASTIATIDMALSPTWEVEASAGWRSAFVLARVRTVTLTGTGAQYIPSFFWNLK